MLENFKKAYEAGIEVRYEAEEGGLWVKIHSPKWDLPEHKYKVVLRHGDKLYHWEELYQPFEVIRVTNGVYYLAVMNGSSSNIQYETKDMFNSMIGKNWFFTRKEALEKHIEELQNQIEYFTGEKHQVYKVMANEEQASALYNEIAEILNNDNQKSCAMGVIREILPLINGNYKQIKEYDLGVNFNGYPLEDIHNQLVDNIMETIPLAGRERKNLKYKVVLMQENTKEN